LAYPIYSRGVSTVFVVNYFGRSQITKKLGSKEEDVSHQFQNQTMPCVAIGKERFEKVEAL